MSPMLLLRKVSSRARCTAFWLSLTVITSRSDWPVNTLNWYERDSGRYKVQHQYVCMFAYMRLLNPSPSLLRRLYSAKCNYGLSLCEME